jgi:hypothetical protein
MSRHGSMDDDAGVDTVYDMATISLHSFPDVDVDKSHTQLFFTDLLHPKCSY